jgi:hypothetical protein
MIGNPNITYEEGRDQVLVMVDHERQKQACNNASRTPDQKLTLVEKKQQDFSMSVNSVNVNNVTIDHDANTVTIDRDHYLELIANAGGSYRQPFKKTRFSDDSEKSSRTCWLCGQLGHASYSCPNRDQPPPLPFQPAPPPTPPPSSYQRQYTPLVRQNRFSRSPSVQPQQLWQQQSSRQPSLQLQQQPSSQQSSTQPPLRKQRYDPAVLQARRRFGQSWVPRGTGPQIQAAAGVLDNTHTGQHSNHVG